MDEIFAELSALQKKARTATLVLVGCIILTVITFFLAGPFGILFFIGVIAAAVIAGRTRRQFADCYKDKVVRGVLSEILEDVAFDPGRGITESQVRATGMMQTGNRYSSNDLITARYKGVGFTQSDVLIEEESTDSEGNTTTTTLFRGRWVILEFNKDFSYDLQVISKGFSSSRTGGLFTRASERRHKVEMEDEAFNKRFRVLAQDEHEAFYILTPHVMEALTRLREVSRSPIMLMFVDSALHIAVQNNKDAFEPRISGKLDPDSERERILADIRTVTDFVDELALDRAMYKA